MTLARLLLALLLASQSGCHLTRSLVCQPRRGRSDLPPDTEVSSLYGAVRTADGEYHLLAGMQEGALHLVSHAPEAGLVGTLRIVPGPLPVVGTPIAYEYGGTRCVRRDLMPAPPDPDLARAVAAEASPVLRPRNGRVLVEDVVTGEAAYLVLPRSRLVAPRNDSARYVGRWMLVPFAVIGDVLLFPVQVVGQLLCCALR